MIYIAAYAYFTWDKGIFLNIYRNFYSAKSCDMA